MDPVCPVTYVSTNPAGMAAVSPRPWISTGAGSVELHQWPEWDKIQFDVPQLP